MSAELIAQKNKQKNRRRKDTKEGRDRKETQARRFWLSYKDVMTEKNTICETEQRGETDKRATGEHTHTHTHTHTQAQWEVKGRVCVQLIHRPSADFCSFCTSLCEALLCMWEFFQVNFKSFTHNLPLVAHNELVKLFSIGHVSCASLEDLKTWLCCLMCIFNTKSPLLQSSQNLDRLCLVVFLFLFTEHIAGMLFDGHAAAVVGIEPVNLQTCFQLKLKSTSDPQMFIKNLQEQLLFEWWIFN